MRSLGLWVILWTYHRGCMDTVCSEMRRDGVCASALVRTGTRQWACDARVSQSPPRWEPCSSDAKGVFGSMSASESAGLFMAYKRSARDALCLRESRTRSPTRLRWLHSDGFTKFDHTATMLIRDSRLGEHIQPEIHTRQEVPRTSSG